MPDGTEPIDPDEIVYRRVVDRSGFYKSDRQPPLSDSAFKPAPRDTDGISFTRAKYVSADPILAAAGGYQGKNYFVIEMRADDLMSLGVTFKPRPLPDDPGHTVIPELNIKVIDAPSAVMIRDRARRLPFKAHGPYPGSRPQN
jgi:hypothetical protein